MGYPRDFAAVEPGKPAMIMAESGARISYADLESRSRALARLMRAHGLERGDTVAVVAENRLEWAEIIWAAARSGLDIAPVNFHLGAVELAAMLEACEASAVVVSADCRSNVEAAAPPSVKTILALDGECSGLDGYEAALDSFRDERPLDGETLGGRIMFSSGTTGAPKAIRHPAADIHPSAAPPHLGEYTTMFGLDRRSIYLSPAPMYHTAPFRFVFAIMQLGGTVVCMEHFDAVLALETMQRYRVTHAQFVPTMLLRMDRLPPSDKAAFDLSDLRVAITGGAPCPPELKDRLFAWWGPVLYELYGASEGYGNTCIGPLEGQQRRGSVGRAVRGRIHITDADGHPASAGQDGIVWFEGGSQNETEDRQWRTVGDIGFLDGDGYLYLTGRANQIIISGGVNIHPAEIENVLIMHPAVHDVAVIGTPNDEYGEIVTAYVVPRVATTDPQALVSDVITYCRDRLAHYKCPRDVVVVNNLPRGDNGKMYARLIAHPEGAEANRQ